MKSQEIGYLVCCFLLTATFISIFFFTYVAGVEEEIIKDQMGRVIDNFTANATMMLTEDQKNAVGKIILQDLSTPDMSKQDREARENNKKLLNKTLIFFSILIGVGMLVIFALWYFYRIDLVHIIKYSVIILILVACTELLFVTFVTKNYRLLDDNYVNYLILVNLQKYAKQ